MSSEATTRAPRKPIVWRDPLSGPSAEGYCVVCGEEMFAGYCACGGPSERVGRMFCMALKQGEADGRLEVAAARYLLEGDDTEDSFKALVSELRGWLEERRRHG